MRKQPPQTLRGRRGAGSPGLRREATPVPAAPALLPLLQPTVAQSRPPSPALSSLRARPAPAGWGKDRRRGRGRGEGDPLGRAPGGLPGTPGAVGPGPEGAGAHSERRPRALGSPGARPDPAGGRGQAEGTPGARGLLPGPRLGAGGGLPPPARAGGEKGGRGGVGEAGGSRRERGGGRRLGGRALRGTGGGLGPARRAEQRVSRGQYPEAGLGGADHRESHSVSTSKSSGGGSRSGRSSHRGASTSKGQSGSASGSGAGRRILRTRTVDCTATEWKAALDGAQAEGGEIGGGGLQEEEGTEARGPRGRYGRWQGEGTLKCTHPLKRDYCRGRESPPAVQHTE